MSKEDISMLQKTGHFYLVLTVLWADCSPTPSK